MIESIAQKRCSKCGKWKPFSRFYRNKSKKSSLEVCCKICQDKAHRKHYGAHPEKEKERSKKWTIAHPEYKKEWQIRHSEYQKEYRIAHPDKIAEWQERRRALKANVKGNVTAKHWRNLKKEYNDYCAYCGRKKPLAMDHIIPLSKGGCHAIDNIVPACKSCNSSKNDSSLLMFLYRRTLI